MWLFTFATFLPTALLILGAVFGGVWVWAALLTITVFTWVVDKLSARAANPQAEFPSGDMLSATLALLHLPMLALAVWAIGGDTSLGIAERFGLLISYGLFFGQVGHPNAHELIHRPNRWLRRLGKMIYSTLLIGHHASAHPLVHHVHVATERDPSSAPRGQGFWQFAPHCWLRGFRAGLVAENRRYATRSVLAHPYLHYTLIALATLGAAGLMGVGPLFALLAVAGYAQIQIMLADYVQHYGLRRDIIENGRVEPVGPQHSWNTPHRYSSAMMLNAPRHSDHHLNPTRPYPGLRLDHRMPLLPYALPTMAVIALWPRLWRRVMDPRLDALVK
ncbi:alkane 1-monooxygenase [Thalassobius sp. Cn5-15]|uniref:alkane 1-monooxygenase n=1 Tax=Thalassobius sp. Cn5-15 TaxID=2917763 RepID=UPI001EF16220|nr:alkane 1-monooxygenase [Thalassobius sp. Cn5-15]MCG7494336.1 alkane 1-monooxygenase [Thalassobius sp. Cn5-15]